MTLSIASSLLGSILDGDASSPLSLPNRAPLYLLDLATGTGSQLLSILKKNRNVQSALGIDLSREMLRIGQKKIMDRGYAHRVTLAKGDATAIALDDESVDCVTMSFGIRNVTDVQQALCEAHRVLKESGRFLLLEFSLPKNTLIRSLYLLYVRYVLPRVAGWFTKNTDAYRYLNKTIETFPYGSDFCHLLKKARFHRVRAIPLDVWNCHFVYGR